MYQHKRISCHQITVFVNAKSRHFIQHGTFQMNNLIVRKYENVFLTIIVTHGKCHLIMIVFAEIWIQFHVIQKIMHPSHVPFISEIQSAVLGFSGYHRPCGGFLCDHNCSRISAADQCIQMAEKFNRFQVFIFTVLIWNPLSGFFTIIQIQHGSNRIHTKTINMILLYPQ